MSNMSAKEVVIEELKQLGKLTNVDWPDDDQKLVSLGVDSITMITFLVSLEGRFGLDIDEAIGEEPAQTFGDLVRIVSKIG